MTMELLGRRKGGRPRRRSMDGVKKDMQVVCVKEMEAYDPVCWPLKGAAVRRRIDYTDMWYKSESTMCCPAHSADSLVLNESFCVTKIYARTFTFT